MITCTTLLPTPSGCSMLRPQAVAVDAINPSKELTEAERVDRLRLIHSDNIGPRGIMAQTPQETESDSGRLHLFRIAAS